MKKIIPLSRRNLLRRGTIMLGSIALIPIAIHSPAAKSASATKGMLHYQESPKDGHSCSDCSSFRPSTAPDSDTGTCKILEGPISPHGWCMAFSRR